MEEKHLTVADIAWDSFYRIHNTRLEGFMKKLESLNKRAAKLGCSPIKVEILGEMKRIKNKMKGEVDVFTCLTVEGEAPSYNGWTFVASIEHTEAGNIIRTAPNKETPARFFDVRSDCEHCNTRRHRKETFVLQHEDGTFKQVGRNCLRDFLGHTDPEQYAKWFDLLGELEEEARNCSEGSGQSIYDLNVYMAFVVECITRFGWVSGSSAREQRNYGRYVETTADRAFRNMLPDETKEDKKRRDFDFPSDESYDKAKVIIEWARELKKREELTDYLHNLSIIARLGYVTWDTHRLAASMANAYEVDLRNIEFKKKKEAEKEQRKRGGYVGEVGKREVFTVTVQRIITFENDFGIVKLHIMADEQGNNLVWYSSSKVLEEGQTYKLKATVKEHKEYSGEKQTVLTRCAVV